MALFPGAATAPVVSFRLLPLPLATTPPQGGPTPSALVPTTCTPSSATATKTTKKRNRKETKKPKQKKEREKRKREEENTSTTKKKRCKKTKQAKTKGLKKQRTKTKAKNEDTKAKKAKVVRPKRTYSAANQSAEGTGGEGKEGCSGETKKAEATAERKKIPLSFGEMVAYNEQLASQGSEYEPIMVAALLRDPSQSDLWEEVDESVLLQDFFDDAGDDAARPRLDATILEKNDPEPVSRGAQKEGDRVFSMSEAGSWSASSQDDSFTEIEIDDEVEGGHTLDGSCDSPLTESLSIGTPPSRPPQRAISSRRRRPKKGGVTSEAGSERSEREDRDECGSDCDSPSSPEGATMVTCDDCRRRFHCACQGITADEARSQPDDAPFLCLACIEAKIRSSS